MTTHTHKTVLSPELRAKVAADSSIGGGNLLPSMLAINPHPDEPFITSLTPVPYTDGQTRTEFSLRDLDHLIQSWSVWYLEQGVRPKDRVAIFLPDSIAYFVHYSAIAQIGAIAVLINWKSPRESAVALCERTGAIGLYTDQERVDRIGPDLDKLALRWITTIEEMPSPASATLSDEARFRHSPDDPVGMMHSSGTTGLPKPVIHTHRTILEGPKFRAVDYKEEPDARIMTALPQSHQGTISFTSYAVLTGQPLLAWRDVTGEELAAAIPEHKPTMVMAFGHAYPELAALGTPEGALDSVNIWVSMGDAVHERHLKNVLARRSAHLPPAAFLDRLGTTELGWGVLMQPRTLATQRDDRCVGRSVGFAEVAVLRENGTLAAPYEYGFLGAKPPSMTVGYWGNQDTLGNRPAEEYLFAVIGSPARPASSAAPKPIRLWADTEHIRAAPGGTGEAKCGGNYGGAFIAQRHATANDCHQVVWLDAREHRYIEEAGGSNLFFVESGAQGPR
ncbi:MAG: AMP-binding protein, partial [Mycobacterium sp.]|nr:AMP-binding protein [Mycobacterium sp.]